MNSKFLKVAITAIFAIPLGMFSSESVFASDLSTRFEQNNSEEYLISCGGGGGGGGGGVKAKKAKKAKQAKARAMYKQRKGLPLTDAEKAILAE
tara:strand:+ start:1802 stop:2083 length:282 start_codon:yes stop_codon:yes gene_type:complete